MRAFRLIAPGLAQLTTADQPEPRAGEVLVRVGASGVCHSDLHLIDAPPRVPLPLTLGHENAGWVEAIGPGVIGWTVGEPVAIYGIAGCGTCYACLRGRDNECRRTPPGGIGITRDGGMAEYLSVPAGQLLPIGTLDVIEAAPLTDAGLTAFHAIELCREVLNQGSTCLVIGTGGVGHMVLQILAATTPARIMAVDVHDEALELAGRVGAHHTLRADARAAAYIREIVGPPPGGVQAVFDCVGTDETLALAASVVSTGGWLSAVGLGGGTLHVTPGTRRTGIPMETRVVMPFWGTRAELAEVIALAAAGRIRAHVETVSLEEAGLAYERLRQRQLHGRAVVIPHTRAVAPAPPPAAQTRTS